jgi:type VI protein secretion system component VasF
MTLLESTEPLFQYVCRLNRLARKSGPAPTGETVFLSKSSGTRGASLDYTVVRNDVKAILEDMHSRAANDFRLSSQLKKVELPLLFFVDSIISESTLNFAGEWNKNRLAYERNELAGDEKFFDLLDEDMKDSSEESSERLAVYYICVGLGFTGIYFKQPEFLRKTMLSLAPRIRRWLDADETARICADAYENVDSRDLTEPPSRKVLVVSLIFLCLTLSALVSYVWLYRQSTRELNDSLYRIQQHEIANDTQ